MKPVLGLLKFIWKADSFSPGAFVFRALLISVFYFASELAGLREYTTFLSGTSANTDLSWQTAAMLGVAHLLLYVAFILLVPISLLTAGLLGFWGWWTRHRQLYQPAQKPAATPVETH
jgi:hypothetical protein